jgi:putative ABC transport system permease protein
MYLTQNLLIRQVALTGSGNQPNMVLFDIQPSRRPACGNWWTATRCPSCRTCPW